LPLDFNTRQQQQIKEMKVDNEFIDRIDTSVMNLRAESDVLRKALLAISRRIRVNRKPKLDVLKICVIASIAVSMLLQLFHLYFK